MISFEFHNKVAIITGAGKGIGYEIALQLALSGANVVLNDIDEAFAEQACRSIVEQGGMCIACAGDASELQVIEDIIQAAKVHYGHLDFAIANAGITTFGAFLEYEPDQLQQLVDLNLKGSFFLAQKAAQQLIEQQFGGRILLMSSVTGHQAHPNLAAYGMTKAALEMLAKNIAVELAPHQITVNAIAPGATITERTNQLSPDFETSWKRITPSGKVTSTHDIAQAALFLLSDAANQITGQSIIVDGGWTSVSPPPE